MKYVSAITAYVLVTILAVGCSSTSEPEAQEFVATASSFANFTSWSAVGDPLTGPDPAGLLGEAHDGNMSDVVRRIYVSSAAATRGSNGQYPIGTMFVKDTRGTDGSQRMITAMAKRGNSFNGNGRDWEWFVLNADGTIVDRGAGLMGNMCNACHSGATAKDFVFVKD